MSLSARIFEQFLVDIPPEKILSQEENLQQVLLWYPVQALPQSGSYVFNGVPAFTLTLLGSIERKRLFSIDEETLIIRFVHPQKDIQWKQANNYSYAILVEAFGSIADYSGWLIFFDCCGNYSGFAGSEYESAELFIKHYQN